MSDHRVCAEIDMKGTETGMKSAEIDAKGTEIDMKGHRKKNVEDIRKLCRKFLAFSDHGDFRLFNSRKNKRKKQNSIKITFPG